MRLALMMLAVAVIAGCGQAATVREAPPAPQPAIDRGSAGVMRPPRALVAPVYQQPRHLVWIGCVRAAMTYFKHIDAKDEQAGTLYVYDENGWFGNTAVDIWLSDADGGTRVEAKAKTGGDSSRPHMVIEKFLARLALEMETIEALRDETAKP